MVTLSVMPNLQDCWLNLRLCLTYTKKCTAWSAERHPLSRYYWTLLTLLSLQRQGSINWESYSWFNKAFFSRNTSLFTAIAVGGRSRGYSQLGATKYKLYSLVLLASEQIDCCTFFMPYFMPCWGAFQLWWMTELKSLVHHFPDELAQFLRTSLPWTLTTATCMTNRPRVSLHTSFTICTITHCISTFI